MKKVLFLCLFMFFPYILDAECDYKTEKNITTLSLYVDYSYEYNEGSGLFDITVYNLQNLFAVSYNGNSYIPTDNKVLINNINPGNSIILNIFNTGNSQCTGKQYRIINITVPYINPYYNSKQCENYKEFAVCYSRFLNFDISETTFKNAITEKQKNNNSTIEEEVNSFDNVFKFITKYYIKFILVIVTTLISFVIYKNKYRKKRHGI